MADRTCAMTKWHSRRPVSLSDDGSGWLRTVRSVTVERIGPVLGRVPAQLMADVDEALRLHLQL